MYNIIEYYILCTYIGISNEQRSTQGNRRGRMYSEKANLYKCYGGKG
jgi:hypothetical protein